MWRPGYNDEEYPRHRVRITRPFYLGTYDVTRGQFRKFVADTHYRTYAESREDRPGTYGWSPEEKMIVFNDGNSWLKIGFEQTDEHPVVCVSWTDSNT